MKAQLAFLLALAATGYCYPSRETRSADSACNPNPCFNGGTCMDMGGLYICVCEPEYLGMRCETRETPVALEEEDPCAINPCLNGGLCYRQDRHGTNRRQFYCVCNGEFTGNLCDAQLLTSAACDGNPCQNGGVCYPKADSESGYGCRCIDSYGGANCQMLPCDMNPCLNGGECFSGYRNRGDFMCRCPKGFKGEHCDVGDPCMDNPCGEGNMCKPESDGGFNCMCPCSPGSTCVNRPNEGDGEVDGGDSETGTEIPDSGDMGTERPDGGETDSGSSGGSGGSNNNGGENSIPQVGGGAGGSMTSRCNVMMRQTNSCNNHGYCHEDGTSAICRCYSGFRGVTCAQVDPSSGSNGGSDSSGSSGGSGSGTGSGGDGSGSDSSGTGGQTGTGGGNTGSDGSPIPQVGGGSSTGGMTSTCNVMMRQTNNCNNNGYCHEDGTSAICRCYSGFRGVTCAQVDPDSGSNGGSDNSGSGGGSGTGTGSGGDGSGSTDSGSSGSGGQTGTGSGGTGSGSSGSGSGSGGQTGTTRPCVEMMEQTDYCNRHGYCVEDGTSAFCRCYEGYRGSTCQHVDDPSSGTGSDGVSGGVDVGTGNSGGLGDGNTLPQVGQGSGTGSGTSQVISVPCVVMMRQTNNCSNNQGYCVEDNTGAKCYCHDGFEGVVCNRRSQV